MWFNTDFYDFVSFSFFILEISKPNDGVFDNVRIAWNWLEEVSAKKLESCAANEVGGVVFEANTALESIEAHCEEASRALLALVSVLVKVFRIGTNFLCFEKLVVRRQPGHHRAWLSKLKLKILVLDDYVFVQEPLGGKDVILWHNQLKHVQRLDQVEVNNFVKSKKQIVTWRSVVHELEPFLAKIVEIDVCYLAQIECQNLVEALDAVDANRAVLFAKSENQVEFCNHQVSTVRGLFFCESCLAQQVRPSQKIVSLQLKIAIFVVLETCNKFVILNKI